jgi:hypothetical protein
MRSLRGVFPALLTVLFLGGSATADEPDSTKATAVVSGRVTLDGQPLPAGWIAFHKKNGKVALGNIDAGKYTVKNPPLGESIRVTIDTVSLSAELMNLQQQLTGLQTRAQLFKAAKKDDAELTKRIEEMKGRIKVLTAMQNALKGIKLNEEYTDRQKTPLKFEIKSGTQTIDIELKK